MNFRKAVKSKAKARIGIIGPSGCGKTYTALTLATGLGNKIAVIDTEHGSASKYADLFEFDVLELEKFNPQFYIDGIKTAAEAAYDVLIIDSLSHAWVGTEGALELADKNAAKYGGNRFAAWRDVTPLHNKLIEAMLSYPGHLIATLRSKMAYIQTQDDKGKTIVKKVGMEPVQREGMEYEFDIVAEMDIEHNFIVTKTRCRTLDGIIVKNPGIDVAEMIKAWLDDGETVHEKEKVKTTVKKEVVQESGNTEDKATDAQIKAIYSIAKRIHAGQPDEDINEWLHIKIADKFGVESVKQLTKKQASAIIDELQTNNKGGNQNAD